MTYNALNAAKVAINAKLESAKTSLAIAVASNLTHAVPVREAVVNAYQASLDIVNDQIANLVALGLATKEEPIAQQANAQEEAPL